AAVLAGPVRLVGLIDAAHRALFEEFFGERGVEFHGVPIEGSVRTCLAVRDGAGRVTELLEPGPQVDAQTRQELLASFRALAAAAELSVLSGSLPPGLAASDYATLAAEERAAGRRCAVDTSGEALRLGVACGAANALTAETGVVRREDVEALLSRVTTAEVE